MKIEKFDKSVSTVKYKFGRLGWTFHWVHEHCDSFTLIDSHGIWRGLFGKLIWLEKKSNYK